MKKYKTIMICDVCKRRVKKNAIVRNHWFLYLIFFASFSFFQWITEFNNKFDEEVICYDCAKSFKEWVKGRKLTTG